MNDGPIQGAVIRFVEPSSLTGGPQRESEAMARPAPGSPPLEPLEGSFTLLAEAEPQLGFRRILRAEPPAIELNGSSQSLQTRAMETAFRLAALLHVQRHHGLLLHAAGISDGIGAFVCLAPSGGGKSTLTDLAQGYASLSDETVAVVPDEKSGRWEAWGTTFRSSAHKAPASPQKIPLWGFLILEKSPFPEVIPAGAAHLVRALLGQTYADPSPFTDGRPEQFQKAASLARTVPAFRFRFSKESRPTVDLLKQLFDAQVRSNKKLL